MRANQHLYRRGATIPDENFARLARLMLTCLLISLLPFTTASARDYASTRENRLAVFDEVWSTVRERYYDPNFRGVDWNALGTRLRPLAADAREAAELYAVLRRMTDSLGDSHTGVRAPGENFDWRHPRFVHAGFVARVVEGEVLVTEVIRRSDAERAEIRAGDKIISVDDSSMLDLLGAQGAQGAERFASANGAARAVSGLFDGEIGSILSVAFIDRRGRERRAALRRSVYEREITLQAFLTHGHVRVLRFDAFTDEIAAQFARAMRDGASHARALVIDLRENGGGDTEAMLDILSWFLPSGQLIGNFTDRSGNDVIKLRTRSAMLSAADRITVYPWPVVVLTSARTGSAAEIFSRALQDAGRARIVGERTCGCVLGARRSHALPDGGTLDVSELDYRTARGARLEGLRILPDETVAITRAELYARRDSTLQRAATIAF